jgi:hypothetical protein
MAPLGVTAGGAVLLIGRVADHLGVEIVLHPVRGEQQPRDPTARDQIRRPPATLLELTTCLSHPPLSTLGPSDDLLGVEGSRLGSRSGSRPSG